MKTHPRFIGYIPSGAGFPGVSIVEGNIRTSTPNYGANDPNCPPSSITYANYTLAGLTLEKLGEYTQKLRAP